MTDSIEPAEDVIRRVREYGRNFIKNPDSYTPRKRSFIDIKDALALCDSVEKLQDELERERVRLSGCSTAAFGYEGDVKQGDYGHSVAMDDVRMIREERDAYANALRKIIDEKIPAQVDGGPEDYTDMEKRLFMMIGILNSIAKEVLETGKVKDDA